MARLHIFVQSKVVIIVITEVIQMVWSPKYRSIRRIDLGQLVLKTSAVLLRKEVIQPQVPLRLPCYDFIPITTHTFGTSLLCRLGQRLRVQTAFMM